MAGDWIKVENVTPDKPEIDAIAEALGLSVNEVIGALVRMWIWADQQTIDGNAHNVTKSAIDRHSGVTGLADALLKPEICWLERRGGGGFSFPNFDRHNGQTAKTRALTAKRVAAHKSKSGNAPSVTKALPREEKRREEKSSSDHLCSWNEYTVERSTVKEWCSETFGKIGQKRNQKPLASDARTRDMLLRVGVLFLADAFSIAFITDATEGLLKVEQYPKNPGGWLRKTWRDSPHLPAGSDFNAMLRQVHLPDGI